MSNVLIFLEKSKLKASLDAGADEEVLEKLRRGIALNTRDTFDFMNMIFETRLLKIMDDKYSQPDLIIVSSTDGWFKDTDIVYGYELQVEKGFGQILSSDIVCPDKDDTPCLKESYKILEAKRMEFAEDEALRYKKSW